MRDALDRPRKGGDRRRRLARRRFRRRRRGISEVIATILLLALTVVLFASIFVFITRFPAPPAQNVDQFQTSVSYGVTKTGGTYCGATLLKSGTAGQICGVSILQSSGPTVPTGDHVYLQLGTTAANWQFHEATGIPVGWGTNNATIGWTTGTYWTTIFSPTLTVPNNITVIIVGPDSLLYSARVPGATPTYPPVITSTYTTPSNPGVGKGFQIFAVITGSSTSLTVNVTLSQIPGLSGIASMTYNSTAAAWDYVVASGHTTTAGTYYAFVRGINSGTGATVSGSVTVTIGGSGSGGKAVMSVTVGVAPQQPPTPQPDPPLTTQNIYLTATVTYNGSKLNVPVFANFTVTQTPTGAAKALTASTLVGQSGVTVSGPGRVLVYSQNPFPGWVLTANVLISATVHLGDSVGTSTATLTLGTPALAQGIVRPLSTGISSTTTITASDLQKTGWSHSCTSSTCPFLYVEIYDNFTAALGFTKGSALYFHGSVYVNGTGGTCTPTTCTTTISVANSSNTVVSPASFKTVNVESFGSTTTRMTAASWWASGITLTITMDFIVYWGSTAIAYVDGVSPYPNSALT